MTSESIILNDLSLPVQFQFDQGVSLIDVEMSLHLAMFAAEGLYGRARVRLEAKYTFNQQDHTLAVDMRTEVGAAIVRLFTGLLLREYGEDAFEIDRQPEGTKEHDLAWKDLPAACH